jgi:hypothetical protein
MNANVVPAFKVEELSGSVIKKIAIYDKKAKDKGDVPIRYEERKVPAGFLVTFPHGHSIRVDEAGLKRLGFVSDPAHIDLASGEVVPDVSKIAQQKAKGAPLVNFVLDDEEGESADD